LFGSHSPNKNVLKPLSGKITTYGYALPNPNAANRLSVWFGGGKIEPNLDREDDMKKWKKAFGRGTLKRHFQEKARVLATKLLLGAVVPTEMLEEDGSMEFMLKKTILGGQGNAYVDVLYLDDNLPIVTRDCGWRKTVKLHTYVAPGMLYNFRKFGTSVVSLVHTKIIKNKEYSLP
jgi:hypothetical protein